MCSCLRKGLLLPTNNKNMSQTIIRLSVGQNLKHNQQSYIIHEVNVEIFIFVFVAISNSEDINRPNAEDQLLVEEYGCTNSNTCISRQHQSSAECL